MVLDLTGEIFGKLTVVGEDKGTPKGYNYWRCECECGGKSSVRSSYLRSGHTKSCGCLRSTVSKELNTTHGLADNRIYNVYIGMNIIRIAALTPTTEEEELPYAPIG